jgi:hypothetical protein
MVKMTPHDLPLLLSLLLAHLVADFFLQTNAMVAEKNTLHHRSRLLYLHCAIHGLLALGVLLLAISEIGLSFALASVIAISHLFIDIWKSYMPRGDYRWFVIDQLLHLTVIVLIWLYLSDQWLLSAQAATWFMEPKTLTVLLAYLLVLRPLSFLIAILIGKWSQEIDNSGSLAEAGTRIGMLERFLILTFILIEQFSAIGFLLAAKSVLRFGDLREAHHRKLTEYVLLGTMLSFAITISLGLLTHRMLALF